MPKLAYLRGFVYQLKSIKVTSTGIEPVSSV